MKRTKHISRKRLYIEELERPAGADCKTIEKPGGKTVSKCSWKGGIVTTLALGEESGSA
jgi:hypothetical protein